MAQKKQSKSPQTKGSKSPQSKRSGRSMWRGSRSGPGPMVFALALLLGAALAAGGWLLARGERDAAESGPGLQINELMADNDGALVTGGEVPDWVEVRNAGSRSVQLKGYSMMLGSEVNKIFSFPATVLAPGECALVYCEGMEAGARHGDWSAPFRLPASGGTTLELLSPDDSAADSVALPELGANEAYARSASGAWEVRQMGTPGADNEAAAAASLELSAQAESTPVELSEICMDNTLYFPDENGEYHDYIEVHNTTNRDVELGGWYLSDGSSKLKRWSFPRMTLPAGGSLAVHCSGYDRRDNPEHLHTDFRLGKGEGAFLCRPDGELVSAVSPPLLLADQAWSLVDGKWGGELSPTPNAANSPESAARVNAQYFGGAQVQISEIMGSPSVELYDWVEVHNTTNQVVDVSNWGLSDNSASPRKWQFPQGTTLQPGEYLGIYLSGKSDERLGEFLNANYSLAALGGFTMTLCDPDGRVTDAAYLPQQYGGISFGRAEGEEGLFYFETSTPHAANTGAHYRLRTPEPVCSAPGGLHQSGDSFSVELSAPADCRIYYTLDSSDPTEHSTLYTGPIAISDTTILRTRAYRDGSMPSLIDTQSYLYDVRNESSVYVVSLVSDIDNLTGEVNGIMSRANLTLDIERDGHIEIFTPDGTTAISQGCSIGLHGMDSRRQPIKSFNVIARSSYGVNRFNYPIFSQRDYQSYQSILLRPSGEDQVMSFMRDSVLTSLMRGSSVMFQECEICVVYLDGQYYTLSYIRERINKYGICQFEGWEGMENDIDIIRGNETVTQGSNASFAELLQWVRSNDMTTSEAYDYVDERVDIRNYIEYVSAEIFSGNLDLLNVRRYRNPKTDGKWRWALYDLDWAFFNDADTMGRWLNPGGVGVRNATDNTLFVACMKNSRFRDEFLTHLGEQLATNFSTENVLAKFEERYERIEPMLDQYMERWDYNLKPGISKVVDYAKTRPGKLIGYTQAALKLSDADMQKYFGAAMQKIQESGEGNS